MNRLAFWLGLATLAAGVLLLTVKLAGGSDPTQVNPLKGSKSTLPVTSVPLKNASGTTVKTFWQLDPTVRTTIRTFIATAVAREHQDQSWRVIAPSLKKGYTFDAWRTANALPVVPYPHADIRGLQFYLDYASTKEILIEVGVSAPQKFHQRPTTFQLGLIPVGKGTQKRWLVDYWMPRWTPPLPQN
ncbi:MAG: hypothetical protein WBB76_03880 [Gaiellaceae bacterium]